MAAINPRELRPSELLRLLNSTPLGEVVSESQLRRHRARAGYKVGGGSTVNLLAYAAWLREQVGDPPRPAKKVAAPKRRRGTKAPRRSTKASNRPEPTPGRERDRLRRLMAEKNAAERNIGPIPAPEHPQRRAKLERDVEAWLRHYIGSDEETFQHDFTADQKEIIRIVLSAIVNNEWRAIAAPRGDGKTTIVRGLVVYGLCVGLIGFLVLIGKSKDAAQESLLSVIKRYFEESDALLADYPEICFPILRLDRSPRRAAQQCYLKPDGSIAYTSFEWATDRVSLPRVDGSPASGALVRIRGADSAIRGLNIGRRPDFVLIDDPDDDESARSELQAEKRRGYIKQGVLGLGTARRPVGAVMLTTIPAKGSVSDIFTDPHLEPAWRGLRIAMLQAWPERVDLWEQYVRERQDGMRADTGVDPDAASSLYKVNRAEMDRGAIVSNSAAYNAKTQNSALQACYDIIADRGLNVFLTEYQNAPPDEAGPQDSGISSAMVARRLSGLERYVCPNATRCITVGVDVGQYRIHYVATAWCDGAAGYVIDYGVKNVSKAAGITNDDAILATLRELRDELMIVSPFVTHAGEPLDVGLAFVDMGGASRDAAGNVDAHKDVVYHFCREAGQAWRPFKGESPYRPRKRSREVRPRYECHESLQVVDRTWLTIGNADFWKRWVHERFITDPSSESRRGTLSLWGDGDVSAMHRDSETGNYAKSIVAEVWRVEAFREGRGERAGWHKVHRENHYLDATYMACCAGGMMGIRLIAPAVQAPRRSRPAVVNPGVRLPDGRPFFATQR